MPQFAFRRVALLSAAVLSVATFAAADAGAAVVTRSLNLELTNSRDRSGPASKTTVVDANADGTNDFSFTHSTNPVYTGSGPGGDKYDYNGKLTLDAATADQFLSIVKDNDALAGAPANYAETLPVGSTVDGTLSFINANAAGYDNRLFDSSGDGDTGAFSSNSGERGIDSLIYVGFAFGNAANPNYGYLAFDLSLPFTGFNTDENGATLLGVAYETTPGAAITIEPIAAPEPASLAAVAAVAGMTLVRRRRA